MTNKHQSHKVRLVARNEGIEYSDEHGVYRFNVKLIGFEWVVMLPPSKGKYYEEHELSEDEKSRILPRVSNYLGSLKYFKLFGPTFPVRFEHEGPISPQIVQARKLGRQYYEQKKAASLENKSTGSMGSDSIDREKY